MRDSWETAPFKSPAKIEAGKKAKFKFQEVDCEVTFTSETEGVVSCKGKEYPCRLKAAEADADAPELVTICDGVSFNVIAREWRCKWSADNDKKSLVELQKVLEKHTDSLKSLSPLYVQRIVCGGCLDFKVIVAMTAVAHGPWEFSGHFPEIDFMAEMSAIPGVSAVEKQTYTIMPGMGIVDVAAVEKAKIMAVIAERQSKLNADQKKKLKAVLKEGGKRGVEIEGAADMGGLQFFSCSVDEPEGDLALLLESVDAMNETAVPGEEERKGCSGHVGKMIFSAGVEQLAVVAYLPTEKQDALECQEWLQAVLNLFGGKLDICGKTICTGFVTADGNNNIFPLKIREPMILESNNFLRKKGLFPEDKDSDDEMVFGDDDFPS